MPRFIILNIGGSLKKYTYSNSKWFLLGMIVPILLFFFAMNSVYAYFTATTAEQQSSVKTATIRIAFKSFEATADSTEVVTGQIIYPGQSFVFNGTIENSGNSSIYAILKWDVVLGGTTVQTKYFTASGTELVYNAATETYTTAAQQLNSSGTANFEFTYSFGFYDYDNTYQGKEVKFIFTARGIQTANISQNEATKELVAMV